MHASPCLHPPANIGALPCTHVVAFCAVQIIKAGRRHLNKGHGGEGRALHDPRARDRASFGPYLLLLSPQDVAAIAVHSE